MNRNIGHLPLLVIALIAGICLGVQASKMTPAKRNADSQWQARYDELYNKQLAWRQLYEGCREEMEGMKK